MGFKDLFIVSDEHSTSPAPQQKPVSKPQPKSENVFPSSNPVFPSSEPTFPKNEVAYNPSIPTSANPFLEKIMDVYDKGFEKLNQPGYDFFEFYKAVVKAGVNNPQVYVMALDMAQSMDGSVTRDSLVRQADYYLGELEKVYNDFNNNGRNKIQELSQKKTNESNSLSQEISSLTQQLSQIQVQISLKQSALSDIDHRYQPEIDEITQKLGANDLVKNKFSSNINVVKMNINNNLK